MEELNAIYERMRAIFAEEAGFVPNDGCDAMVRLYALASEVQSLLAQADWVLDQSFPQTAVGQYLDYHAETRALTRLPAAKAAGVLRFSAPSAAALQAYFTGERLGEAVYTAKLANILYGVEGVKNCHLLTPDEDVSVSATELPVLGTVTITEIGAGEA